MGFKLSRLLLSASLLVLCSCGAPDGGRDRVVWLVHATDPHLFYGDDPDNARRLHQEKLNRDAFEAFLRGLAALPKVDPGRSYLVISGDFGIDRFRGPNAPPAEAGGGAPAAVPTPSPTAPIESGDGAAAAPTATPELPAPQQPQQPSQPKDGPSASRSAAVAYLVDQLAGIPIKSVYLVPGNNDVLAEAAVGPEVDAAAAFFGDVQKGLDAKGTGVVLQGLTACYRGGDASSSGCYADLAGTPFRLLGLPSYSFKNVTGEGPARHAVASGLLDQAAQLRQAEAMVEQARAAGRSVLVVTHIPELDDPYALGLKRFQGVAPSPVVRVANQPAWADTTPWNLDGETLARWRAVVGQPVVAGVLAGHFHDSHREIYRPPYDWAPEAAGRADLGKLFVAPPLSVRFQDQSPIQARGFALFALRGRELERRLAWLEPATGAFRLEEAARETGRRRQTTTAEAAAWLWDLPLRKTDLARAAVIAIALLAAFLTVVAVWQIPPPSTVSTRALAPDGNGSPPTTPSPAVPAPPPKDYGPLLFSGNFARTVMAGLGGLALVATFDSLWTGAGIEEKPYYLVLFVAFFVTGLLLSGLVRGGSEALRSRISIARRPVQPRQKGERVAHHVRRLGAWILSWRSAGLVFSDTFLNVIQGRNVMQTAVFEQEIADLHESIVRSVDRIREELDQAFYEAIQRAQTVAARTDAESAPAGGSEGKTKPPGEPVTGDRVRTAIALLSWDESSLFYVSRERGSLPRPFGRRSLATFSVLTGLPRWWRLSWSDKKEPVLLLGPEQKQFPELPSKILLDQYFEYRAPSDYAAFVILPVPWAQRGGEANSRRAGILVSFSDEDYLTLLWPGLDVTSSGDGTQWTYPDSWKSMLTTGPADAMHVQDELLSRTLLHSVQLLAELLRKFNDSLFEDFVRPRHQP